MSTLRRIRLYKLFSYQNVPEINIILHLWCFNVDNKHLYFFKGAFCFLWITIKGNWDMCYRMDMLGIYYKSCIWKFVYNKYCCVHWPLHKNKNNLTTNALVRNIKRQTKHNKLKSMQPLDHWIAFSSVIMLI